MTRYNWKSRKALVIILFLLALGFTVLFFAGCSNSQMNYSSDANKEIAVDSGKDGGTDPQAGNTTIATDFDTSKIVYSGQASLYVDSYDQQLKEIEAYVKSLGGFVESLSSTVLDGKKEINQGYMTVRIPSARFDEFKNKLEDFGQVASVSINATNISQQYQDVNGELESLRIQEARLLEYLSKVASVTDMLTLEKELNRIRTEIESRVTRLSNWDKEIAYSNYTLTITQSKAAPVIDSPFGSLLEKIKGGFTASLNSLMTLITGIIVLFFILLPYLIVAAIIYLIIRAIIKKVKIKRQKKQGDQVENQDLEDR